MNAVIKERPILFSAPMVRAIIEGTKTQTRRVVKPQPFGFWDEPNAHPHTGLNAIVKDEHGNARDRWINCPYGQPGDRLWVRETWLHLGEGVWSIGDARRSGISGVAYAADDKYPGAYMFPSIHMPREFSRILLEVVSVRVERLQDISDRGASNDCTAEGVFHSGLPLPTHDEWKGEGFDSCEKLAFKRLWESINGAGSWDVNPWVWVVEFRRITPGQQQPQEQPNE